MALPADLWATLAAARRLVQLDVGGLYAHTGLVAFPGAAVILVPAVAIIGPRSAWLTGAALAVQPLVVLALPVVLAALEPRRLAGCLARAAAPSALLLGAAAAANWRATFKGSDQPAQLARPSITPRRGLRSPRT